MDGLNALARDFAQPLNDEAGAGARTDHQGAGEIVMPVPDGAPEPVQRHPSLGLPTTYTYRDGDGRVLGYVNRFDLDGGRKEFLPLTLWRENGVLRWRCRSWPRPRPLYGLDLLAAKPTASVVIVEGEKAADAARAIFEKSVVVTSCGGAKAARSVDWRPLARRHVLIWPDNDEPGSAYAVEAAAELTAIGAGNVTFVDAAAVASATQDGGTREPIIGWDAADGIAEGWEPKRLRELVLAHVRRAEPAPSYVSFDNFAMNDGGLVVEVTKGKGEARSVEEVWCSAAFEVIGRARDPQGQGWARWLRWRDPDGRKHEHSVTDAALHGDLGALAADLASRGLAIDRNGRGHLGDYLNRVKVKARVTTVGRTGWHTVGDTQVFVLPNQVIGQPTNETVVLTGAAAAPYGSRGTLEDWRQGVGRLSAGHGRLVLAIATALAGSLVHLVGGEGGGLNLYGQSSKGKTTTLRAAASVWGRGSADPGFVRSWRATANAQEATAAIVTDTLLALDEIGVAEGRDAAAAVYQLASGVGKGRSARDGSMRSPMTWRVLTLSTGEIPMAAKIAEDRQRRAYAGQAVRLLDIPADSGKGYGVFDHLGKHGDPARLADAIKDSALSAYGVAGPAFVRGLVERGLEDVAKGVNRIINDFVAEYVPADADGQVRRAAARLGLIAAAGELAQAFNIAPWAEGEAEAAAARALKDWIATRGGSEPAEVRESIAKVRQFFEAHGDTRFEQIGDMDTRPVTNRVGWRKGHGEERVWLVLPESWKNEVCAGLDPVATARVLAERGMLKPDKQGKFQRMERTPVSPQPIRVYAVLPTIFEGGSDA
ncbi:hypothetical protein OPKNFCMD_4035 [Methylobacterium crusticola]|uniref:DUF927 domain-containing protein n=1 Tax=Methylobacterium crusticola TaxID=1697972 RepID=A0ABQ4R1W8_9HYPH|nr:DUF927 domain-containing protein [Methylobacterium crusticola]GJD51281.1 hypothetical protein OPKNFCMD_4035 [Methylobacterium crusticola]